MIGFQGLDSCGFINFAGVCDLSQSLDYDPSEFHQIRWFEIDEILFEKTDPHMKRFIHKMLILKKLLEIK